jgi:hypothetical protein
MPSPRQTAVVLALALLLPLPVLAVGTFSAPPAGDVHFRGPVANVGALPACTRDGDFRVCTDTYQYYVCKAGTWHSGGLGAAGTKFYNGAGVPSSGLGIDGDYYIRTATGDLYERESSAWSVILNLKGADGAPGAAGATGAQGAKGDTGDAGAAGSAGSPGATGADGKTVRNGSGAPSSGLGVDGDFYYDPGAVLMYGPKASGAWSGGVSLRGAAGSNGTNGSNGAAGANGATWSAGNGAPSNGTGANGDFYFRNDTGAVYLKTAGAWSSIANLTGPAGANGANGTNGADGSAGANGTNGTNGTNGADGIPRTIQDEGVDLTQRLKINFVGAGVAATDDAANSRTNVTVTTPAHASTHQNGGGDEVATATAAANAIPKAGAGGTLALGWIPIASNAGAASNFLTAYDAATGLFSRARPACADLSNAAASCATDTTNASNITTGTLAANRVATLNQSTTGNAATATSALATTSAAGVAASVTTTAAAATASTTAGTGVTVTADPAVAGTTNAGAAQGGAVTIAGGAAAKLTSGDARGGAINLTPGAGIGTGPRGSVVIDDSATGNNSALVILNNNGGKDASLLFTASAATCTLASLTRSGSTATATCASGALGIGSGAFMCVFGADQGEYNGCFAASRTASSPTAWTYTVANTPATPATGTIRGAVAAVFVVGGNNDTLSVVNLQVQRGSNTAAGTPGLYLSGVGPYISIGSGGSVSWTSTSTNALQGSLGDTSLSASAAGIVSVDTSTRANGAGTIRATAIQLVPTSGLTCDSARKGKLYVASGDGSLCSCNGTVWTPTPLTGTCN